MAEASDHDLKNVTILVLMIILTSSSVQESTRRSHKWSPEPLNILRGSPLLNVSSAITQGPRLLRLPTGTSYPNTWVICTFFLVKRSLNTWQLDRVPTQRWRLRYHFDDTLVPLLGA
jgi:hypothetical protein